MCERFWTLPAEVRRIGPALVFERLWEETGCRDVIKTLAGDRNHGFALERAIFLTVLHRLFGGGSDRAALAADPFAIEHDQGMVDLLEAIFVAEHRKPAIDRAPWRQIARQQTLQAGEVRSRAIPYRSRRFGIGWSCEYAAFGWLGSTWQLRGWCQQPPWNHVDPNHSTPFETASQGHRRMTPV
jgi:hypothetical protein